ncbi:MAG: peptidoglycan-binding protein [Cyanobacteria bacterium P01_D01_bin.1]
MAAVIPVAELLEPLPLETLYEGDRGPAVIQLQTRLSELNFYASEITSLFDAATKQAVYDFQAEYGVTEEAGFFGPKTWYALTFWSKETELPNALALNSTLRNLRFSAIKQRLRQLVDTASMQPQPLLMSTEPKAEVESGKLLFWPFANKREGVF